MKLTSNLSNLSRFFPKLNQMTPNHKFLSLTDDDMKSDTPSSSGCTDSMSTLSTNYTSYSAFPNYDNTLWAVTQPNSKDKITRYVLKRTVFVYGVNENITKQQILWDFSRFGTVIDIIGVNDSHYILGTPKLEHAKELTKRYVPSVAPGKSTCFYIIFDTKGGFNKCAQQALHNPNYNIFKMDKRLKDFNLHRSS